MPNLSCALRTTALVLAVSALVAIPATAQKITIGEHVEEVFETPAEYPMPDGLEGPGPRATWTQEIHYPGATYIAPHFERMNLPPGDFVVVRSPDGEQIYRYTRFGKRDLGKSKEGFFAAHIKGDTAIIELHSRRAPRGQAKGFGYRIDRYGRGFNDVEVQEMWDEGVAEAMNLRPPNPRGAAPGPADWSVLFDESVCGTDDSEEAKCYQGSDPSAYDESRAVARLMLNGNAHCTGWLVGCEGHIMTNEHCIGSQSQANNIDFEFMAEGASCATNCASSLACAGTLEASGGTLVAVDSGLDYALVLPDTTVGGGTDLNAVYGYMQLRGTGPTLGERVYVPQHPAGWGKRIAMESTHGADSGFVQINSITEPACQAGGPTNGEAGYYGDTQGGSSGSPVLGYSDDRVVALHHCRGGAACTGTGGDPNRGVPIDLVIADLGAALPACSVDSCSPQPTADAGPDRVICLGDSTVIGTPAQSGNSYSWSPGGATTAQVNVSPTTTTTYTVTATTSCRSEQDSVVVSVDDGSSAGLSEDFEGTVSGWTATGLWHQVTNSACASPGYSSPVNAFYYGQDATCNYDTGSGTSGTLTSPPLSGINSASTLSFDYFRQVESFTGGSYDQTRVEIVTGSGATTVFALDSTDASTSSWTSSGAISLAAFAGQTIQIRFVFDSVDGVSNGFTGWMVDDVVVSGESPCSPPGNTPPTVTITAPTNGTSVSSGTSVQLTGTATDAEDGNLSSSLAWSSDLDGSLGSGASVTTSSLSVGSHTITASVTDSGSLSDSDSIALTVTGTGPPAGVIDWSTTATVAYSNQDGSGSVTVEDSGATLALVGNRWRRTTQTFTITPYTTLEVELLSTNEGEIHGIGFDENDTLNDAVRIFQLHGTQNWTDGDHHYDNEYTAGSYKTYTIPVGAFYTGSGFRLVLANDKDSGTLNNDSRFRNVRVYEATPTATPIDFGSYSLTAYSNQDATGSVSVEDGGATLLLSGNRWRRSTQTYTVTPNTVVSFDFQSTSQGEIHGLGFDENDTLTDDLRILRIFGSQNWASDIDWVRTYTTGDLGTFKTFVLPIGREYTGSGFRLVFTNDDDASSSAVSRFRNVRVYELP